MFFKVEKILMENQRLALQSESSESMDEAAIAASNIPSIEHSSNSRSPAAHSQSVTAIGGVSWYCF